MIEIRPFKGVLYNQKNVALAKVVAPPYDVISPLEQERFYRLHPANIIRLILGKIHPRDNPRHNRYSRAVHFYKEWLGRGLLVLDNRPSFYVCKTFYRERARRKTRTGFIALASLKGGRRNKLFPHERTFSGPKKDRLSLVRACRANFSQIFTLYSDPQKKVTGILKPFMTGHPLARVKYRGEEHLLWKVNDKKAINKIKKLMQNKNIFIADGHHRYEVARTFRQEMEKKFGPHGFPGSSYTMLYFSNMDEEGLSILATHRLVRTGTAEISELKRLEEFFKINSYPYQGRASLKKALSRVTKDLNKYRQSFGLLARGKKVLKVCILKDRTFIKKFIKEEASPSKKNLPVTVLDEGVLKGIFGLDSFEKNISYTRDMDEAVRLVEKGLFSLAFFLGPTSLEDLKKIASRGERMPHKSTYFYPKLLSGLVIYDQEKSLA
jgi:uncharacterized protein (DUF1015 family)